jgi:hypothetical protein
LIQVFDQPMNILSTFPTSGKLLQWYSGLDEHPVRAVNGHLHTPFSFSAFSNIEQIFSMADAEQVDILGINDFYVTDGYSEFYHKCLEHKKFPLFNIEFIGLMKEEQSRGIRINDPNNPGRIYLSGKGLAYPFHLGWIHRHKLAAVIRESQEQVRQMVERSNTLLQRTDPDLTLEFKIIKTRYAKNLVRERHIAQAIRETAYEKFPGIEQRRHFFHSIYGKEPAAEMDQPATVENEIRANLLKAGGPAFVPEQPESFMPLDRLIRIITSSGGIPCYPVLLDDAKGNFTEFEHDKEALRRTLTQYGIGLIELIPGRNRLEILKDFVHFFHKEGFGIIFGTEHNSPDMLPITVSARMNKPLDEELRIISNEGAALIAAHQYLRAKKQTGIQTIARVPGIHNMKEMVFLGRAVIEYYINLLENES